jgi:hypothetical protein
MARSGLELELQVTMDTNILNRIKTDIVWLMRGSSDHIAETEKGSLPFSNRDSNSWSTLTVLFNNTSNGLSGIKHGLSSYSNMTLVLLYQNAIIGT